VIIDDMKLFSFFRGMTSWPEENFYRGYDYSMGNLGISLLFPEIEGYGLRYQSLSLSRIVMVNILILKIKNKKYYFNIF